MRKRILCYGDSNTWGYMPGIGDMRRTCVIRVSWQRSLDRHTG